MPSLLCLWQICEILVIMPPEEEMMMKYKHFNRGGLLLGLVLLVLPFSVFAQQSSSSSYQVQEAQFGSGGIAEQCSGGQYCAQGSLGANAVGRQSSDNFDAQAGILTENQEFLEFVISDTQVNLGVIDSTTTGSGTVGFYIRSYISSGYTVYSVGEAPSNGGEQLDPLTTGGVSTQGVEQFGINLVDNATPDIGSDFSNIPDDSFADGYIMSGYDTPDTFRYVNGEAIVSAPQTAGRQGTGRSDYTISYIANAEVFTPAGTYIMLHDLIAVTSF